MELKIYSTLSRKKEYVAKDKDKIGIYFCGMTVQSSPHIGHFRGYVMMDLLKRWLLANGVEVMLIENFTDIDDKIIEKSFTEKIDYRVLGDKNIEEFMDVVEQMNIIKANVYPRATRHIQEMVELIEILIDKGIAYKAGGDVYFSVEKFADYGKLSKKRIEDLIEGARVEPSPHKQHPLDFALWKGYKQGEPWWDAPWGRGRPGWHIECSVMSTHYLGANFDIHAGGVDLIFPHHENEIAQFEAGRKEVFARLWMHIEMLNLKGSKMSKSTKNVINMSELLKEFSPEAIRLYLYSSHYRKQMDFNHERLKEAESGMKRIKEFVLSGESKGTFVLEHEKEFVDALNDDLNAPIAISYIFNLVREGYELINKGDVEEASSVRLRVRSLLSLLGFRIKDDKGKMDVDLLSLILDLRKRMREEKLFKVADMIRDKLSEIGIQLKDTQQGTEIIYVKKN